MQLRGRRARAGSQPGAWRHLHARAKGFAAYRFLHWRQRRGQGGAFVRRGSPAPSPRVWFTRLDSPGLKPVSIATPAELEAALAGPTLVIAAGAAGTLLLPAAARKNATGIRLAIDLNAVPPLGIQGVEVTDKGVERDGVVCYGAIGIG